MSTSEMRNIGQSISVRRAGANAAATAGGAGDNTAVTGVIIDKMVIGNPQSLVAAILYTTTLGASATLSIAYTLQHGDAANLSDAATFATATTIVATGSGTFAGELEANIALMGSKRYLRLNYTPDLSAASTDTAALAPVLVFGGADRLPQ
jgi:hypothetical protein